MVKVISRCDHHQHGQINKMTRIVPGRAVIGVFRLIGMGLGWPRDQMAGSVRQWRQHEHTHSVTSHRDRAIDRYRSR